MAIIYTYPVKTVPSLQDSIVITDEADNKKTKITGIGAIIALITGDFCTTSMSKINPDVGDIVSAVDCATVINFTSSDASVTITGNDVAKIIDFTAAGGGGGCPPTYVIKPSDCVDGDCVISTKIAEWVWTCDETLGALAPGYIDNLTLNGTSVPNPGGIFACWYIELATFSASATTCETCCPPLETVYKLSPCYDGEIYYTTETLTSGIAALVGSTVLIGALCYFVTEESGDPQVAVVIGVAVESCESEICTPPTPTYSWLNCTDGYYITVDVDPGIPVGQIDRYCCDEGEIVNYCFEYKGNIGELVGGLFPCDGPIETYPADCMCCQFPCTYQYVACPGRPGAFPPTIDVEGSYYWPGCECATPDPDIYITIGEETWCYNTPTKVCLPPSSFPTGLAVCGDDECPTPEVDLRWKICSEGVDNWRYEDELNPIPAPFNVPGNHYIGELNTPGICVNGDCCIEVEETISLGVVVSWDDFLAETSCDSAYNATWEDCACCVNHDVVEYTTCSGECEIGISTIYVDVCLWGNSIGQSWKPINAPTFITLNNGDHECCYEMTDQNPCIPETLISTHGFSYDDLGYGDPAWIDCTCTDIVYFQYRECGSEVWIDTDTNLDAYNGGGSWQNLAGDTCYEIQEGGAGGPIVDPALLFVTEFFGVGELLPCDCCEQILREYTICPDPVCNPSAATTLLIDVALVPGWTPISHQVVVGEALPPLPGAGILCCYTLEEEIPTCQPPTGTIWTTATDCEDEECNLF